MATSKWLGRFFFFLPLLGKKRKGNQDNLVLTPLLFLLIVLSQSMGQVTLQVLFNEKKKFLHYICNTKTTNSLLSIF